MHSLTSWHRRINLRKININTPAYKSYNSGEGKPVIAHELGMDT